MPCVSCYSDFNIERLCLCTILRLTAGSKHPKFSWCIPVGCWYSAAAFASASSLQQSASLLRVPMHFNSACSGVIAQLSLPDQDKQAGEARGTATPHMTMEVDWDLGVSGHSDDITEEDEVHATRMRALTAIFTSAATMINCSFATLQRQLAIQAARQSCLQTLQAF